MRWTRFGSWLIAAGMLLPFSSALAAPVMVTGTFQENLLIPNFDTFTITNAASSATGITTVRYNLAPSQARFDPADSPFAVVSGGNATGFNGMFTATATTLTLNFTDFGPGETFSFRVDVDDNIGFTLGRDFEDSILAVTFANATPNMAQAAFVSNGLRQLTSATAVVRADVNVGNGNVPEPGTAGLLLLGLAGLLKARRRYAD
jgi:hypothetical protein